MQTILHSPVSVVHVIAALLALITGTTILFTAKGTARHRQIGWLYAGSMAVLLITAFQIYYLFGRFGVIHWGAVGSITALLVGLGAVALRAVLANWLLWHYVGMGASVTGLYAAFVIESSYRFFPPGWFWYVTMGGANTVFVTVAVLLYGRWPSFSPVATSPNLLKPVTDTRARHQARSGFVQVNNAQP